MTALPSSRPNPWLFVLAGGLLAGTFDIVYACTVWGLTRGVLVHVLLIGIPCAVFASLAVKSQASAVSSASAAD